MTTTASTHSINGKVAAPVQIFLEAPWCKGCAICAELCAQKVFVTMNILLVDANEATNLPHGDFKIYPAPITRIDEREVGRKVASNMVALGLIAELSQVVTNAAIEQIICKRVPQGAEEINRKAFRAGREAALKQQSNGTVFNIAADRLAVIDETEALDWLE